MQQHPELIELQALAAGILDPSRQRAVDEHLGGCSECAKTYVEVFLGRSGGAPKGATGQLPAAAAPVATPVRPATPIASPPARGTPQPAFAVEPAPAAPYQVAATARPVSPSPTRVETVVTLRSGEQPTVELHEVPDAGAGRYGGTAVSQVASAPLGAAIPLVDLENPTPAATAAQGSDAIAQALQEQPTLTEAITRLRSSGMSHIARALTPPFTQAAVPAAAGSIAPARPAGPNKTMLAIAAGAALLIGGGAIAYKGMVNAAREAAVAATRAPATPPTTTGAPASGAPVATPVAATTGASGAAATTTTSGGTVAAAPAAPARESARETTSRESASRETRAKREEETQKVAEKPSRKESAPALPSVALPDVSGAVSDDGSMDRLSGRSASRAAATDLQRSAGWATSRTTAKP